MTKHWFALYLLLMVCLSGAAFTTGALGFSHDIVHVKHAEKSWGKADRAIDGAQINPGLEGLTCFVYEAKRTVVCK